MTERQVWVTVGVMERQGWVTVGVTETQGWVTGYDGDTGSAVVASLSAIVPPDAAVSSQVKTKHYTGTNQHTRKLISARNT